MMKTCPVCQATCFDDMDVCYGCLHQFSGDTRVPLAEEGVAQGAQAVLDPLEQARRELASMPGVIVATGYRQQEDPASEVGAPQARHGAWVAQEMQQDARSERRPHDPSQRPTTQMLESQVPQVHAPATAVHRDAVARHVQMGAQDRELQRVQAKPHAQVGQQAHAEQDVQPCRRDASLPLRTQERDEASVSVPAAGFELVISVRPREAG